MNKYTVKKELLREALSEIDTTYLEQAENFVIVRERPRGTGWMIAAACLALAAVAALTMTLVLKNGVAQPDPQGEKRTVFGNGETIELEDVVNFHEVRILGSLMQELQKEENSDALFCVEIDFLYVAAHETAALYDSLSDAIDNAQNDPAYLEFEELFYEWLRNVKAPTLTAEEIDAIGQGNGLEPYYEEFFHYVEEHFSPEKANEYRTAKQRFDEAAYEYDNYKVPQQIAEEYDAEVERLISLGYRLDPATLDCRKGSITAYLDKDQIERFEVNTRYIYAYILFFAGDDMVSINE